MQKCKQILQDRFVPIKMFAQVAGLPMNSIDKFQALAGVLVALTDVITLATGRDNPCNSAFWYFSFGIFAVAVSLASYMILLKLV